MISRTNIRNKLRKVKFLVKKVKIIFSVIKRENVQHFVSVINHFNPHAFYTIEDVKSVNEGVFRRNRKKTINRFGFINKKGK